MRKALTAKVITPAVEAVREFVTTLPERYAEAVKEKDYCIGLERLRVVRNDVAHKDNLFSKRDYAELVRQAVCQELIADWHSAGPAYRPVPWKLGTLHHHLLAVPPLPLSNIQDTVTRLFDARPAGVGGGVRLTVRRPAIGSRARLVPRTSGPNTFSLGSRVVVEVTSEGGIAGHLVLLNQNVFGMIRVLARGVLTDSERFIYPSGEFDMRLTDGTGEELVKTIVSRHPLPLPAATDDPTPELSDTEVEQLVAALDGLPAGDWWEATVRLTVTG